MKKRDQKYTGITLDNLSDLDKQALKRLAKARGKTVDEVASELFRAGLMKSKGVA